MKYAGLSLSGGPSILMEALTSMSAPLLSKKLFNDTTMSTKCSQPSQHCVPRVFPAFIQNVLFTNLVCDISALVTLHIYSCSRFCLPSNEHHWTSQVGNVSFLSAKWPRFSLFHSYQHRRKQSPTWHRTPWDECSANFGKNIRAKQEERIGKAERKAKHGLR